MLKILRVPDRAALQTLIQDFDPQSATWVVSDLRSKFEIQQRLLDRDRGYLDTSVLRASDLWKTLLKRAAPAVRVISRDFAKSIVRHFLTTHREALALEGVSENFLLSLMDRFAGIIFHPNGERVLEEWFSQNEEASTRWKSRYQVAGSALKFIESQNLITAKWVAAALQMVPEEQRLWDRPLIVDLGAELTSAEAVLFHGLSQITDVTLLEPMPSWRNKDEFLLRPYRDLEGFAKDIKEIPPTKVSKGHRQVKRFSGQLAEVKEAVAQARAWMENGIASDRIAILAPEIEEYWPVLKPYLDEEGLPCDKAVSVKLNALPVVNRWLARLRPRRGELTPADLELAYYAFESNNPLRYEEFRSLFANLYGEEDLHRHEAVQKFFEKRIAGSGGILPRDVFLEVASRFWESLDNLDAFLVIAREVLQNAHGGMELSLGDWIRYVESIAASKEMTITPAASGGLFIGNFSSAHAHPATHRIFLGLSEEGLRKAERNPLPMKDIREISKLGFHLDHPDQSLLEFELKWLCENPAVEDILLVGVSTFDGSIRAPSALWMKYFQETHPEVSAEAVQLPQSPRWDLLQSQPASMWEKERNWSEVQKQQLLQRLSLDLGEIEPEPVKAGWLTKMSPSLVKTYLDCPFRLASSTLFRLKDLNEIDLDLARSDVGNLTHAVFQTLTDDGWTLRPSVADDELQVVIEDVRKKLDFVFAEESLWIPFLRRQIKVAQEFLRVEREWKKNFPSLQILKSETEWKIYFHLESGEFSLTPQDGTIELKGRIDRLESDGQKRFVVVDYKASKTNLHHHTDWLGENELQLLFYMWALEQGALIGIQGQAIGAFYYVYKNFTRDTGFQIEDEAGRLFPSAGRKKKLKADVEDKVLLFEELENRIRDVVTRTSAGDWAPKPHENNKNGICERCSWNGLCRASHLN